MVSVLIADDEAIERAVLKKTLLKNLGDRCRLFEAENGRQVLELYEKEKFQIAIQDAAKALNYSETYFIKLFKQCFQKNFTTYLTEYRVEEAKKQLQQPTVNVKDVGKAVGYGDSNYFTKVFRRITGMSPTEYRTSIFREE